MAHLNDGSRSLLTADDLRIGDFVEAGPRTGDVVLAIISVTIVRRRPPNTLIDR